jgi:hypothetical protein
MNDPAEPAKTLAGAWELVSGSYVGEDGVVIDYAQAGIRALKVLSGDRFSFVTTTQGAFYAAAAGRYTAGDGRYVETPDLASHPDMVGKCFDFQFQVDGDTWENSRWQDGVLVEHEIWRRVR